MEETKEKKEKKEKKEIKEIEETKAIEDIEQLNPFSVNFDMKYVLKKVEKNFTENKDLLYDVFNFVLNSANSSKETSIYENKIKEKQKKIILNTKMNYKKLDNVNYIKYYLPYCVQPETNNTNISITPKNYQTNIKQNILKELHIKKQAAENKIDIFLKRYTGQIKKQNVLHTQVSKWYKKKCSIEVFIKNEKWENKRKKENISFTKVIGDIVFFDKQINILLQNAKIKNKMTEKTVPWIFIQGNRIVLLKEHTLLI